MATLPIYTGSTGGGTVLPGAGTLDSGQSDPYFVSGGFDATAAGMSNATGAFTPGSTIGGVTSLGQPSGGAVMAATSTKPAGTTPTPTPTPAPVVDPYAKFGGKAAYDQLVAGFNGQKDNIYGTANDAANTGARTLNSGILDFIDQVRTGQQGIDQKSVNNEMARTAGTEDVIGMVGRGIRSGGVTLANKNASSSSAAEAIAKAYGDIGRRQLSKVGNQYEVANNGIALDQANQDNQRASGQRKLLDSEAGIVDNIVTEARNKFAALDSAMLNASIPERIQIEQEKAQIKAQVEGILSPFIDRINNEPNAIQASSQEARRAEATRLAGLGQAPANAFNYSTDAPAQFQNSGPFASELPIFTGTRGKREA